MARNVIEPMASDGLRTIGLAYKDYVPIGQEAEINEVRFVFVCDVCNRERFWNRNFGEKSLKGTK